MKFNKFLVVGLFVVSLIPTYVFGKSYSVSAKLDEGLFMMPYYYVTSTDLKYDRNRNIVYAVVNTEGDCRTYPVQRCRDVKPYPGDPNHAPYWRECWMEYDTSCNHQTGYYPLPSSDVIFDGKTRIKFVGDGQYQTIARYDRILGFLPARELNMRRENARIGVSGDLREAILLVETDN